jgi:hypothetical protein
MTTSTSSFKSRLGGRWLATFLATAILATQGVTLSAHAQGTERERAEQDRRAGRPAPPQGRPAQPPAARPQIGPPVAARPAPPQVIVRPNPPPPAVARGFPQPGYAPPPPRPRYEADRRDRDYRYNRGVAIGVGAAIIGATLGYRYYRGPNRESVYDRCDRNFPEFDYDTGTFTNEDGDRELCPYLRAYVD